MDSFEDKSTADLPLRLSASPLQRTLLDRIADIELIRDANVLATEALRHKLPLQARLPAFSARRDTSARESGVSSGNSTTTSSPSTITVIGLGRKRNWRRMRASRSIVSLGPPPSPPRPSAVGADLGLKVGKFAAEKGHAGGRELGRRGCDATRESLNEPSTRRDSYMPLMQIRRVKSSCGTVPLLSDPATNITLG